MRRRRHDESGESLVLVLLWPPLLTASLVLLVHAFIVTNARAEAEVAASEGLRSAWRAAAASDFLADPADPDALYTGASPHPGVLAMAGAARDAVAQQASAAGGEGWRWWSPGGAEVHSDWCAPSAPPRPGEGETGWVRVVVTGEVFGPLAALWPDRWDRVYAAAQGPAVLASPDPAQRSREIPAQLPVC
ncbi:MAG: hypothetical protein F4110_07770 [Acidimicrobiaceae bacterium]|nr:hypothetical protein [Acidimicrobiaceae bacterium]MXZ97682.1 hypothetical protein [Acidimicrobiaceae bacterium]MYE75897.1 hypothetical protein [Acidimicrobiaceae bacterium]MYE96474.1 hypothetical protein [Acidimicrobiaceae bacterium]MYI53861.1 hypothetical protein [Acidimicrobiaceae bacterium]